MTWVRKVADATVRRTCESHGNNFYNRFANAVGAGEALEWHEIVGEHAAKRGGSPRARGLSSTFRTPGHGVYLLYEHPFD